MHIVQYNAAMLKNPQTSFAYLMMFLCWFSVVQSADAEYTVTDIRENNLVGKLYLPENLQSTPAVVIVGGSSGRLNHHYPAMLAERGFAALSLAYFNAEGLPASLDSIPVETVTEALDYLQLQPSINTAGFGIIGISRGSELAFLSASLDSRIQAVVGVVPSSVAWHGQTTRHAWTYQGVPVPSLTFGRASNLPMFQRAEHALRNEKAVRKAQFQFTKINGPVLLISAKNDRIWPSETMSTHIVEHLKQHDFQFPVQHKRMESGHLLNLREWPDIGVAVIKHFADLQK